MGCFDLNGSISNLPITYKDECFLLIWAIELKSNKKEYMY